MIDEPENELFSAYLDGELTAEDRAKVERLLAASPAARQLLDELRALSSTLQSMPRYELGEDISQQVLRKAERQILTQSTPPDQQPSATPRRPIFGRLLNPRMLFWPAAAVAVALMLMLFGPQQPDPPPVAVVPDDIAEESVEEKPEDAASDPRASRRTATRGNKLNETAGKGVAAESAAPRDDDSATARKTARALPEIQRKPAPHPDVMQGGDSDSSDPADGQSSLVAGSAPTPSDAPAEPSAKVAGTVKPTTPAPAALQLPASKLAAKPGPALPAQQAQPPEGPDQPRDDSGDQTPKSGIAGKPSRDQSGQGLAKFGAPARTKPDALKTPDGSSQYAYDHAQSTQRGVQTFETASPDQIACVVVDLSAEAARERVFDKLLPTHDIDWDSGRSDEHRALAGYYARGARQQKSTQAAKPSAAAERAVLDGTPDGVLAKLTDSRGQIDLAKVDLAGVDLVWVEATRQQIEATLDDLNRRREAFVSLNVDPAREVQQQQQWKRYSRVDDTLDRRSGGDRQAESAPAKAKGQPAEEAEDMKKAEDPPAEEATPERNRSTADQQRLRGRLGSAWRFSRPEELSSGVTDNQPVPGGLGSGAAEHGQQQAIQSDQAEQVGAPVQRRQAEPSGHEEPRHLVLFILRTERQPSAASASPAVTSEAEASEPAVAEPTAPNAAPATEQ